jgi:hypothetical protein
MRPIPPPTPPAIALMLDRLKATGVLIALSGVSGGIILVCTSVCVDVVNSDVTTDVD